MEIIGFIIVMIGALLFFGGTMTMNRNERKFDDHYGHRYGQDNQESKDEFIELLNQGVRLIRIAGIFMVFTGGAVVLISYIQ